MRIATNTFYESNQLITMFKCQENPTVITELHTKKSEGTNIQRFYLDRSKQSNPLIALPILTILEGNNKQLPHP